jgi:hypothetical protein
MAVCVSTSLLYLIERKTVRGYRSMDIYPVYVIFNKSGEERDYVLKHAFSNGRFGIRMKLRSTSHLVIEIRIYS